jgi:acyl carrier protein
VTRPADARDVVAGALTRIVPDADLATIDEDTDLRRAFELDSLDFLEFVEHLSGATGVRIDEEDYPQLATLARCRQFLATRGA